MSLASDPLFNKDTTETPWERIEGENNLWYGRFFTYLNMGPSRTLLGAVHIDEARRGAKGRSSSAPGSWFNASRDFKWKERAQAYDEHLRKEVFTQGAAYDLNRIASLDKEDRKLADKVDRLADKVETMLDAMKPPKGGFNFELVRMYLETQRVRLEVLDALAKETGGRIQRKEIAGPNGGPVEVLLFLPEQEKDDTLIDDDDEDEE
jgi:hypothetical protein